MALSLFACVTLIAFMVTGTKAQLDVCGTAPLNSKIVGGEDAPEGAWPWQVSLHRNGRHFCGGSLINDQYILTAAHCIPSSGTSGLIVYLGRHTQQSQNNNQVTRLVSQIIAHPQYSSSTNNNDIALFRLNLPVSFTDYIRPVCLAAANSQFATGTICWVTGWGDISSSVSLPFPQTLQEVNLPIVSNAQCNQSYPELTSNMICAGLQEGGKDSCQGDSGGPMVVKHGSVWIEAGIVSFGDGCARPDVPGVYTRVSEYEGWIKSHTDSNVPGFVEFYSSGTSHVLIRSVPLLVSILPVLLSLCILS
ncbi:hypothetical protein LDENG_00240170 [Lucifuga dentata]|nr:hypothetical protein LDENG_00240170 [Lucifuga dentata]